MRHILVIDDQRHYTGFISRMVKSLQRKDKLQDVEVLTAQRFDQADELIGTYDATLALVATDVLLHTIGGRADPDRCGPAVYWRVREFTQARTVFLCASGKIEPEVFKQTQMNALPPKKTGLWSILDTFSSPYKTGSWIERELKLYEKTRQ